MKNNNVKELVAFLNDLQDEYDDHTDEFLQYVNHESPEVRIAAVEGLWHSDLNRAADVLLEVAQKDTSPEVQAKAVATMGRYIYEELWGDEDFGVNDEELRDELVQPQLVKKVKQYLAGILADESQPLLKRRRALESLSVNPGEKEKSLIEKWASSDSAELRMTAVFSMGRSGLNDFDERVLAFLEDADPKVQHEAVRAAGELGLEEAIPFFEKYVGGDNKELKFSVIEALENIGGEDAERMLIDIAEEDPDTDVAEAADDALDNIAGFEDDDDEDEVAPPAGYDADGLGRHRGKTAEDEAFEEEFDPDAEDLEDDEDEKPADGGNGTGGGKKRK